MTWVRIGDEMVNHPKMIAAGPMGIALQIAGLCYAARYLTDGKIPAAAVPTLLPGVNGSTSTETAATLVRVGSWTKVGEGYRIHDYLEYNPSRKQVLAQRKKQSEGGRKGAGARWREGSGRFRKRASQPLPEEPSCRRSMG